MLGTQVPVNVARNAVLMMRFLLYITEVLAGPERHSTLLEVWHRVQASNAVNDVVAGSRHLQAWSMADDSGTPTIVEFMSARSAGQLRTGHIYADTERVLREIAEDRGDGDRIRSHQETGSGILGMCPSRCSIFSPDDPTASTCAL
jgi:hypothetical protein